MSQITPRTFPTTILVASDLHLGDPRADDVATLQYFHNVLKKEKPELLVLAGDILEGSLASRDIVQQLSSLCHLVPEVIVLMGNHDGYATERFANDLAASLGTILIGKSGASSFVIEHGNRFDSWWSRVRWLGLVGIWCQHLLYRVFAFDLQGWLRKFKCIRRRLLEQHMRARDAWPGQALIVTGHTHLPAGTVNGLGYFNSGDWVQHHSYVTIANGFARLVRDVSGV